MSIGTVTKLLKLVFAMVGERLTRTADGSRVASNKTIKKRRSTIRIIFTDLFKLGYKLQDPANLKHKHIIALGHYWESVGYSASVIQNRLSCLRVLAEWIGKPGLVRDSTDYVKNPGSVIRKTATSSDKGLEVNADVSWAEKIVEASEIDERIAAMLVLGRFFGLRATEALLFRPREDDLGFCLMIRHGTKGGLTRVVEVDEPRRWLLEKYVTPIVRRKTESMCWPELTADQGYDRLQKTVSRKLDLNRKALGTTFHGARHDFINGEMARLGYVPPVRGGNHKQQVEDDADEVEKVRNRVIRQMGHKRDSICGAYVGTDKSMKTSKPRLDWSAGARTTHEAARDLTQMMPSCDTGARGDDITQNVNVGERVQVTWVPEAGSRWPWFTIRIVDDTGHRLQLDYGQAPSGGIPEDHEPVWVSTEDIEQLVVLGDDPEAPMR